MILYQFRSGGSCSKYQCSAKLIPDLQLLNLAVGVWLWGLFSNMDLLMSKWLIHLITFSCQLVVPCVHILSSAGSTLHVRCNHWHLLWPISAPGGSEVIFHGNSLMHLGALVWYQVQSLFWYLLGWVQYILGSLQINFS